MNFIDIIVLTILGQFVNETALIIGHRIAFSGRKWKLNCVVVNLDSIVFK